MRAVAALVLMAVSATLCDCDPNVANEQIAHAPPGPGTWVTATNLPTPLQSGAASAVATQGLIQFMGGSNGASSLSSTYVYDSSTGTWAAGGALPVSSGSLASAVTPAGDILAMGGANAGEINTIQLCTGLCLNGSGAWSSPGTLTTARERLGAVTVGGLIYLVGGCETGCPFSSTTRMESLDPTTLLSGTLASLPASRLDAAVQAVDGVVYVIGGNDGASGPQSTVFAYDIATDSWNTRSSMPIAVEFAASGVLNGLIYVVGGGNSGLAIASVQVYDPAVDKWYQSPDAPQIIDRPAFAVLDDQLYVMGGDVDYGNTPQTSVMVITP